MRTFQIQFRPKNPVNYIFVHHALNMAFPFCIVSAVCAHISILANLHTIYEQILNALSKSTTKNLAEGNLS